ncbi:MAG: hypothetical protein NT029_01635 [Armatimonadetes bacterium]|nr:hypothetical protein [Armatimonadota bacterium]
MLVSARWAMPAIAMAVLSAAATPVAAQSVLLVPVSANGLAFDPHGRKLWATVGSGGGAMANSVVSIDPDTGSLGKATYIGSEPNRLVVSDKGKYLYVVITDGRTIRRFDIARQEAGLQFPVGEGLAVTTLAPMPGAPEAVVVMRHRPGISPNDAGVAVYDNGQPRPRTVGTGHHLAPGIHPTRLFGYENQISSWGFTTVNLTREGAEGGGSTGSLLSGNVGLGSSANGLIVAGAANVIDPEARQSVGSIPGGDGWITLDAQTGRALRLSGGKNQFLLTAYDLKTFAEVGSIPIMNIGASGGPGALLRCDDKTLAFSAGDRIVILKVDVGPKLPQVDLSVSRSAFPEPLPRNGQLKYTLTVTNNSPFACTGVHLTDALPPSAEVLGTKMSQGSGVAADHIVRADLGSLKGGARATVEVSLQVNRLDDFAFAAVVRAFEPDPSTSNNISLTSPAPLAVALPDLGGAWRGLEQRSVGAGVNLRAGLRGVFEIANLGERPSGPCLVRFYLSAGPRLVVSMSQLLQEAPIPALAKGRSYLVNLEAPLERGDDATGLYVIAVIDPGGAVAEKTKDNNVVGTAIP